MTANNLVLRMCRSDGRIHGLGILDATPGGFQFPAVGEAFEWSGPELAKIPTTGPLECELDDRHLNEEGVHAYSGRASHNPELYHWLGCCARMGYTEWLVLSVADGDLVHDKHRVSGRCRIKRGVVAYRGNLAGAAAYMRAHWPEDAGPAPEWADETRIFPSRPPV